MDGAATTQKKRRSKKAEPVIPDEPSMPDDTDISPESAELPDGQTADAPSPALPDIEPHRVVEAILMAAESPLSAGKIASILGTGTARDIKNHTATLNAEYDERGASFRIEEVAGGYQILTRPEFNAWLVKLLRVRQETKLTPAVMETLAIIAYKQPCTRAEVEAIRGVAAGDGVNRLREMNLVKIVGRAEDLGRPLLYGTTKRFLEVFGLPGLEDLPQVEALRPPGGAPVEQAAASDSGETESDQHDHTLQIVHEFEEAPDDAGEADAREAE